MIVALLLLFLTVYEKKRERSSRSLLLFAALWCDCSLLLSLGVRLLICCFDRIVGLADPSLAEIFTAWRTAEVTLPIWLILLCGAGIAGLILWGLAAAKKREGRRGAWIRTMAVAGSVLLFLLSFVGVLWLTKINSVPVYVLAEIIGDLVGAL